MFPVVSILCSISHFLAQPSPSAGAMEEREGTGPALSLVHRHVFGLKPLGRTCASPCWWVFQKGIPFFRRQHVWRIYICLQMFDMSEIRLVPLGGSFLFHVIRYNVVTLIWIWVLNEAGCKEQCPLC